MSLLVRFFFFKVMLLNDEIDILKGIGSVTKARLNENGIFTIEDMLSYYPCEYRDVRNPKKLSEIAEGDFAFISVGIKDVLWSYRRGKNKSLFRVLACDGSSDVLINYFNQSYLFNRFKTGETLCLYGRLEVEKNKRMMTNPQIIDVDKVGNILPIYRLPGKVKQKNFREAIKMALEQAILEDFFSSDMRERYHMTSLYEMYSGIHEPSSFHQIELSTKQASMRKMIDYEMSLRILRNKKAAPISYSDAILQEFLSLLPFQTTDAQLKAMRDIACDMQSCNAMNRLLQGDVGSGKTCVAFFAAYLAMKNGVQTALMAPTEILAEQHYANAKSIFKDRCELLTGSIKQISRELIKSKIESGHTSLIIGTHALLYGNMKYHNLNLVITDEQHRFGVAQRAELEDDRQVHALVMSATPIPRTLSLILFGETGISVIDTLPKGRKQVKTSIVSSFKRRDMYKWLKEELKQGKQAYVVCPLIEHSDELNCKSAIEVYEELKEAGFDAALLHGQLKPAVKNEVMRRFKENEISVLVTTTVIEVGVDVKNANIMIVENAERFGLAQLHQLRGRVGRGNEEARCFLVSDSGSERLKILKDCADGFKIAEEDLKQRGAGDFLGVRQSGFSALRIDEDTIFEIRKLLDDMQNSFADKYEQLKALSIRKLGKSDESLVLN